MDFIQCLLCEKRLAAASILQVTPDVSLGFCTIQFKGINNEGVKEAVKQMEVIMETPQQRDMVWRRKLAELDYNSQMKSAMKEAKAEGLAEGMAEGEKRLTELLGKLFAQGRVEEAERAVAEQAYRESLYLQYNIGWERTDDNQ